MELTQSGTNAPTFEFDARILFERILVPVDFSEGSRRALATALELRRRFGSEVHLFRLTELSENDAFLAGIGGAPNTPQALVESAEERLRRFVENVLPGQSREVIVHARVGVDVVHGIARGAKHTKTTLVLLGRGPERSVFRTQIEKIVQELDSAVMLIPAPSPPSS